MLTVVPPLTEPVSGVTAEIVTAASADCAVPAAAEPEPPPAAQPASARISGTATRTGRRAGGTVAHRTRRAFGFPWRRLWTGVPPPVPAAPSDSLGGVYGRTSRARSLVPRCRGQAEELLEGRHARVVQLGGEVGADVAVVPRLEGVARDRHLVGRVAEQEAEAPG